MNTPNPNMILDDRVSMQTKLSYGFGALGKDFSLALVNTFLFFYLTDVAKVSVVTVSLIFFIARVWDTVNDPIWGYIVAKTNTRWGKYKPWIFIGNIFNCLFMVACFATHLFEGTFQVIYLAIVYIGWGMAYTICDAPYWCLVPIITADKREREGLLPYPRFSATLGGYAASAFGVGAVAVFGQGDQGYGYIVYAAIGGILAIISAIVACKGVEEKFPASGGADFSIKDAVFIVTKNKQFIIFMCLASCYCIGTNLVGAMNLYFFKYVLNDETLFSNMMYAAMITAIPCLIFFKPVVVKIGRKVIFCAAISSPAIAATFLVLAHYGAFPVSFAVILAGVFTGLSNSLYWLIVMILVADTVDYGDVELGVRSESMYYSLHTLLCKSAGAIGGVVIGGFLALVDYVPNVPQSEHTVNGMVWLYYIPALLCVVGMIIYLLFYKLHDAKLDEMHSILTRRAMDKIVKESEHNENIKTKLPEDHIANK